jgi:hypothetical protein
MSFDDREKALERKWERDQETAFKVRSRRRRLLAEWAAERLGFTGAAAEAYVKELMELGLHKGGDAEELDHIQRDLAGKGVAVDRARLQLEAERCEREAKKQLGA